MSNLANYSHYYDKADHTSYHQYMLNKYPAWEPNSYHLVTIVIDCNNHCDVTILSQMQDYTTIDISEEHMSFSDFLHIW